VIHTHTLRERERERETDRDNHNNDNIAMKWLLSSLGIYLLLSFLNWMMSRDTVWQEGDMYDSIVKWQQKAEGVACGKWVTLVFKWYCDAMRRKPAKRFRFMKY